MSISTEITRLQTARNTIRTKLTSMGMATATDTLDTLATSIDGMIDQGAVSAQVQEGSTYTIPKGYHNGSGTVSGVSGGGNYSLQSKSVTPTKQQQNITPASGYYGLSDVTVEAIPAAFQDVTSVTATPADVLANKIIVDSTGAVQAGTMPNNGAVSKSLSTTSTSYTIPKGYHSGTGSVAITLEEKSISPQKGNAQVVTPTSGKVLSKVTVEAIPSSWCDTSGEDVSTSHILEGDEVFLNSQKIIGTMPINNATTTTLNTTTKSYTIPTGYHNGTGKVTITTEEKSATPTKSSQTITPTTGRVLSKVTVAAIPAKYVDTTDADAVAGNILDGKFAYINSIKVEGTMPNNGAMNRSIDGMTTTSVSIPLGYTSGGTVTLNGDIEAALAAI